MTETAAVSTGDVATTVNAVERELAMRGIELFAKIDHAAGARAAGLELADEVLLVFGNPAVGTAILQADPQSGLDLPLRMLVWDDAGQTRVAYHDPKGLAEDYALADGTDTLSKLEGLLRSLVATLV